MLSSPIGSERIGSETSVPSNRIESNRISRVSTLAKVVRHMYGQLSLHSIRVSTVPKKILPPIINSDTLNECSDELTKHVSCRKRKDTAITRKRTRTIQTKKNKIPWIRRTIQELEICRGLLPIERKRGQAPNGKK
mmetsp:Transcript_10609/g.31026  ORF Transcript_10609/g.31026 Transcript_10609/m.31026 type:complete len:136 (+) Transcript_10609:341-748(+)